MAKLFPCYLQLFQLFMDTYGNVFTCFNYRKVFLTIMIFNLTPENYGWKTEESALCPQKHQVFMPKEYTVSCKCQKGCTGRYKWKPFEERASIELCVCAGKC